MNTESNKIQCDESMMETKDRVKELIRQLKGTEDPRQLEEVKLKFKEVIRKANPLVIALAENELAKEGFSMEDLMSACEVHLMLFKDAIAESAVKVPEGHPIRQFQIEHKGILKHMEELRLAVGRAKKKGSLEDAKEEFALIDKLIGKLMEAENHNVRQENTLFPVLESHGIEQPPAIMWADHTDMKEQKKDFLKALETKNTLDYHELVKQLERIALVLTEKFAMHSQKEEHILYATAMEVITEDEWKDIGKECDELGYFEMELK